MRFKELFNENWIEIFNKYKKIQNEFLDTFNPMERGKYEKSMRGEKTRYRYKNNTVRPFEYIESLIRDRYSPKNNKMEDENGNMLQVTKIEYKYAEFILNNKEHLTFVKNPK
jgi:hypothetical protein